MQGEYTINRLASPRDRLAVLLVFLLLMTGCGQGRAPSPKAFVVKCGDLVVSDAQFSDELDLKLSAYPFDLKTSPKAYNAVVLDLVSVLTDEVVLLAAARDGGVSLSNGELARAEAGIREDYPEDSFEQMLLENAIPYEVWKKKLEKDMVIEKFVRADLIRTQEITPEDVVGFYQQYAESADTPARPMDENSLVRQLRMEKSQASYGEWLSGLKASYPVEINQEALAAFLEKTP